MTRRRRIVLLMPLALAAACGPVRVQTPAPPRGDLVVLLPDDGTTVGRVIVSNAAGRVDLSAARDFTVVSPRNAPTTVAQMSEADVQRLFGDVLAALPPPPQHFILFFRFESEELTDGSRAVVQEVLKLVKARQFPDVSVLGHTDTTGTTARNFALGLRRANSVRALLINTGLDPSSIDVISHGEAELLVPTADGVSEARNRRVEITVR